MTGEIDGHDVERIGLPAETLDQVLSAGCVGKEIAPELRRGVAWNDVGGTRGRAESRARNIITPSRSFFFH